MQTFEIGANRIGVLLALLLRRQRERHGLTLAQAAERLGQRSKNAYSRYEQGTTMPTVEKLEQLRKAIAPDQKIVWHIAEVESFELPDVELVEYRQIRNALSPDRRWNQV